MFTGIISDNAPLDKITIKGGKKEFLLKTKLMQDGLKIGDSIACNGICLTVIGFNDQSITVEAMNETLIKTTANLWRLRQNIHLERAMLASGRFDGHIVQGHIDCTSHLISKQTINDTLYLEFFLDSQHNKLVVPQGSIAINGVSLTVSKKKSNSFEVSLISHTLIMTHFSSLRIGDSVNLEFDIIGKYIINMFSKTKISEDWLKEKGF
ncbi:MAG: riboflavin synthase [Candidatus Cloacimonadales bacterium]|jgi:riboflavin synthase|nr:riboflavin synthase [Candidatus Cloacimonadota bacterium]MDD2651183.1 riboflavin synthase [Candidatus Cloacimonadota bacterium]MDX9976565.1 riboflavin synthase [Candidatus Cloacimonadales bacterium]